MTRTETISVEQVEEIKKTYFIKLGYTNAIQSMGEDKAPADLICKYGEACHEHQLAGDKIVDEITRNANIYETVTSWSCNFDDNSFTINY